MRIVRWLLVGAVVGAATFLAYGSWRTSNVLLGLLTVGGETAQGSGWPAPQGPFDIGYVGDPREAIGADFDDVSIEGDLGVMPAWLIHPDPEVERSATWAIVVHGIGGRRENGYRFVPPLLAAGMPTLLVAYRNDRDAPRSPEGLYAFGLTEWRDLESAVEHALANGASAVALLGESMGGGIVGQFMRRSALRDRVSALLFDAPALDFPATLQANMRREGAPVPRLLGPGGMLLLRWRAGIDMADADVLDVVARFPGPLFISHGASDRLVPVATSDRMVERRDGPTEYLRTDADHILSWKGDPARYDAALTGFLDGVAR